ncbi:MAG TPA: plasmid maintenance toxin (PemK-like) [Methylocystis sp.]|nr:plasmid maintenance toxin (PemK-like) [Methylocystis sp.]
MIPRGVKLGHVFNYAYLWDRERRAGRDEASKDRPCLVLALVVYQANGAAVVRVLPITHSPPLDAAETVEIPQRVKARLRLDDARSWIVLSESNVFTWPGPDLRPTVTPTSDGYYGPLPPNLFNLVRERFVALARTGAHRSVPRHE